MTATEKSTERKPNRKCAPLHFATAEREKNGRIEYQLLHGNRIIARSFDRAAIDAAWENRAALAKQDAR